MMLKTYYKDKVDGFEIGDDIKIREEGEGKGELEEEDWDNDEFDFPEDDENDDGNGDRNDEDEDDDDDDDEDEDEEDEDGVEGEVEEKVHLGGQPKNMDVPPAFKNYDVGWEEPARHGKDKEKGDKSLGEWFKVKK